jgi:hypothetical protein
LWDNLSDNEILEFLNKIKNDEGYIVLENENYARDLAKIAESRSMDKSIDSPFSLKAKKCNYKYKGGKQDDITVIISQLFNNGNRISRSTYKSPPSSINNSFLKI